LLNEVQLASPAHSALVLEQYPLGHINGFEIGQPYDRVLLFNLQ